MSPESPKLSATTSGFVLAAIIAIAFNTVLAWTKDAWPPLNSLMASLTGHQWTTHGLAVLIVFLGFGLTFTNTRRGVKIHPVRLTGCLIAVVAISALGLVVWYAFV